MPGHGLVADELADLAANRVARGVDDVDVLAERGEADRDLLDRLRDDRRQEARAHLGSARATRRIALTMLASTSAPRMMPVCSPPGVCAGQGQPCLTGSPNAVWMSSIPSSESTMWLGAGKTQLFQPMTLYAVSQAARMRIQIRRRLRLPEILGQSGCADVAGGFRALKGQR